MYCRLSRFWVQIFHIVATAVILAFSYLTMTNITVNASEYGKSVYPPGFRASMSGLVPPAPGTYVGIYKYFYAGEASGAVAASRTLDHFGGNFSSQTDMEVEAVTFIEIPNVLWMTPHKILGGKLGFGAFVPIGWQDVSVDVDALATLTLPALGVTLQRAAQFSVSQDTIEFGDPWQWR